MSSQPCFETSHSLQDLLSAGAVQKASQATVVLGLALIAWAIASCIHRGVRAGWRPFNVPRLLWACWQEDPVLRQHADAQQVEFWRVAFKALVVLSAAMMSYRLAVWHRNGQGLELLLTGRACERVSLDILSGYFSICFYILLSSLVFTTFPSLLTKRKLYCWIALTYVVKQWHFIPVLHLPSFFRLSQWSLLTRVLLSTHCSSVAFIVLLNLAASIHQAQLTVRVFEANSEPWAFAHEPVQAQMVAFVLILIINLVNRRLLLHQIRSTLAAKSSRNVEASTERLLSGVCDVVVHLRSDFTLDRRSPQLDVLLLRSRAFTAGGRESFLDFLYEDADRQRFREFIQPEAEAGSLPGTLHVAMRDVHQAKVPVQLFQAEYLDAMDERFHIVGIIDQSSTEERQAPAPAEFAAAPVYVGLDMTNLSVDEQKSHISMSESSASSQHSAMAEVLPQLPDSTPGEAAVWIDAGAEGMPMVKCTSTFFTKMGGPSLTQRTKLLSWIPKNRRIEVRDAIQDRMNGLLQTSQWEDEEGLQVCLQPRHMARHRVRAKLFLSLPLEVRDAAEQDMLEDLPQVLCKMTFTRLQHAGSVRQEPSTHQAFGDGPLNRQQSRHALQL